MHWLSASIQSRIETLAALKVQIEQARETLNMAHGAQATRRSGAQARERRPLASSPGGGRHSPPKAGGGKDHLPVGAP